MTAVASIGAISGSDAAPIALRLGGIAPAQAQGPGAGGAGFGELLMHGLQGMDAKVANANQMVERFAVDDTVPVHQVTMALEQARLSVEMAMQVRARLVEGYRELMNMQL